MRKLIPKPHEATTSIISGKSMPCKLHNPYLTEIWITKPTKHKPAKNDLMEDWFESQTNSIVFQMT